MGNDNRWKQLAQMMAAVIVNEMREQWETARRYFSAVHDH